MSLPDDAFVVARVGRPQGVRGEVTVEVRTDVPEKRLLVGSSLLTDPDVGPLVLESVRQQGGRTVLQIGGVHDRDGAEGLRGLLLLSTETLESDEDSEDWALSDLVGLRVELEDGTHAGTLVGLDPSPAHDLLLIDQPSGTRALLPFVRALVPVVDVPGGRVVVTPPGGLLDVVPAEGDDPADGAAPSGPTPDDDAPSVPASSD